MPLFGLKNAKRKISSPSSLSSLVLRKTQSTGNIEDSTTLFNNNSHKIVLKPITPSADTKSILRSPDQKYNNSNINTRPPSSPPLEPTIALLNPVIEEEEDDTLLASKLRDITACDMELLLSLETQARMDCQEEKEKKQQSMIATAATHRPSTVKFELPITPPRSKSPDPAVTTTTNSNNSNNLSQQARQRRWSLPEDMNKKKNHSRLSRWSKLIKQQQQQEEARNHLHRTNSNDTNSSSSSNSSNSSSTEDNALLPFDNLLDQQQRITIGSKVKLFKRPLPIIGTVKYLGKVHFDTGDWLGIELDSRGKRNINL